MRHRARVRVLTALACLASASALPGLATAGTADGLHVDPESPVAKEYALPLASARGAAPESGQSGKLFGSGITTTTTTTTVTSTYVSPPASTVTLAAPAVRTQVTLPATTPTVSEPASGRRHGKHRRKPAPSVTAAATVMSQKSPARTAEAVPAAYTVLSPGGDSGILWMVAAGFLVVVLGAAGGVARSRRR